MSVDHPARNHEQAQTKTTLLHDVVADVRANSGLNAIGVIGVLAWLVFQWGFGNDVLLPTITARVYNALDQPPDWVSGLTSVLAATAVGGAFWAITQLIDAVIVLTGLRLLPRVSRRLSAWLQSKYWVTPVDEMRLTTRWAIAYGAGASVICLIDALATGRSGIDRQRRLVAQAVALSAGTIAAIIAVVAVLTMAAQRNPTLEPTAAFVAEQAADPLTWIVIIVVVVAMNTFRRRLRTE